MKINLLIILIILFLAGCGKSPKWVYFSELEIAKSKSSNVVKFNDIHPDFTSEERLNFEEISGGLNWYIDTGSLDPSFGYQLGGKSIRTSDDHSDRITAEGVGYYWGLNLMFSNNIQLIGQRAEIDKFQTIITDPGEPGKNRYDSSLRSDRFGIKINIPLPRDVFIPKYLSLSYMNYTNTLGIALNQIVPKGHILSAGLKFKL